MDDLTERMYNFMFEEMLDNSKFNDDEKSFLRGSNKPWGIKRIANTLRDLSILNDYKKEMEKVKMYKGDNYYHPLAQCVLAQQGDDHKANALLLGHLKEIIYDRARKSQSMGGEMTPKDFNDDVEKDLINNYLGSIMGTENPTGDCRKMVRKIYEMRLNE